MTKQQMLFVIDMRGFTLIETIIYIGLFGILMVGVVASVHPILSGIERMNEKVMVENEITVMSRSITSLIPQIDPNYNITPNIGTTDDEISFTIYKSSLSAPTISYIFADNNGEIIATVSGAGPTITLPLTTSRVHFDDMIVKRVAPSGGTPGYFELSYVVNGITYGPIRSYLNF